MLQAIFGPTGEEIVLVLGMVIIEGAMSIDHDYEHRFAEHEHERLYDFFIEPLRQHTSALAGLALRPAEVCA